MILTPKKRIPKYILPALKILVALFIAIVLAHGYSMPQDVTIYSPSSFTTLSSDWTQLVDGNSIPLDDIDDFVAIEVGSPIVIGRIITADMVGQCVLFYAEHQTVIAQIDGVLVYSLTSEGEGSLFGTPGRSWVSIPITDEMVGQTLHLEFSSAFSTYQGLPAKIYSVAEGQIYMVQVYFLLLRNSAAFLMLILAAMSYIHAMLWKMRSLRRFLFLAADFYLSVGLWLCAEVNVLAIWFGRALLSAVMSMVLLRIIPITLCHFFIALLPYSSWRTRLVQVVVWGNLFLSLILQFIFAIPMLYLVPLNLFIIVLGCILGIVELVCYHRSGMQFMSFQYACYSAIILFSASLAECLIYLNYQDYGHLMGVPLTLACFIYYVITYIFLTSLQSETAKEKQQLEQTIANLTKRPLNQQINAHFLYNSLNTISAYCREDGEQAYEAIRLLGQYMRAYTYLIGADDYVALEEELDLMQTYMVIQNMRFENSIRFVVHNTCDDVLLPPLTLQPLVENAVNHGIRKKLGGGTISIVTLCKHNMAEIIVSDDGVGFDVTQLTGSPGVGIQNLERRIKAMGGNLTVKSTKGRGTDVILMVPMEHTALEEKEFEDFICGR